MIKNPPPWPEGARCAVGFSFDVDADVVVHAAHGSGALDLPHAIAHMRYDPAVGLPRLVDLFADHEIPLTCFMPGWVIDTYPEAAECVLRHGRNEVAHHGHLHLSPNQQSLDAQRRELEEGTRRIERLTGKPPRGYRAPYYAASRHTFDLLIEAGLDYDSSLFADDVPILLDNGTGSLVELPVPASVDDYNQYVSSRAFDYLMKVSSPRQAVEVYQAEFDAMWAVRRLVGHGLASGGERPPGAGARHPRADRAHAGQGRGVVRDARRDRSLCAPADRRRKLGAAGRAITAGRSPGRRDRPRMTCAAELSPTPAASVSAPKQG